MRLYALLTTKKLQIAHIVVYICNFLQLLIKLFADE